MPRFRSGLLALLLLAGVAATADAQRRISGRVTGQGTGEPLVGASVTLVGSTVGTYTVDDGRFALTAPDGDVQVLVRRIGFKRKTVGIPASQGDVAIALERDVLQLEAQVVTGQATTMDRRNAAVASTQVTGEKVSAVQSASLENALQGKVVGANINMNSGAPGGGGQVQIRGVTSILGNGAPLYVVDGIIVNNDATYTGLNAVTGAGAGIASTQDNPINRIADINPNEIESVEVLKAAAASAIYGSKATNGVIVIRTKRGLSGKPRFNLTQRIGSQSVLREPGSRTFETVAELVDAYGADAAAYYEAPHFDYQGALYGNSTPSYETVLSLSGGDANTRYYASGSTKKEQGVLLNTDADRNSLRLNVDQTFGTKWTAGVTLNVLRSLSERGISNNDNSYTSPIYNFAYTPAVFDLQRKVDGRYRHNPFLTANPFETIEYVQNREDVYRQLGSVDVTYAAYGDAMNTVTLRANAGLDRVDQNGNVYSPNFLQFESEDDLLGTAVRTNTGVRQMNGGLNATWAFAPTNGLLTATTTIGGQLEERTYDEIRVASSGLVPGVPNIDQGTNTLFETQNVTRTQALNLSEEVLAFGERLTIQGGVRAERSSRNGDAEKFFVFPRAAAAYRFVSAIPYVDELKLRASWGQSGNQPDFSSRFVTQTPTGRIGGNPVLRTNTTVGNPNIEPETMTEVEVGFDAQLLGERVGFEATYFDRTITNLLLSSTLAPSSGFGSITINGGELATEGYELALTLIPLQTNDWSWISRTTYYTYDGVIEDLPVPPFNTGNSFGFAWGRARMVEGNSVTAIYGNIPGSSGIVVGEATPDYQMGFSNDLSWRDLRLSTLVDWKRGGQLANMTQTLFDEGLNSRDYEEPSPDPDVGATLGEYRYESWAQGANTLAYLEDASYVKVREVALAYSVPESFVARLAGARSLTLSVTGRNLFIFSDYWGSDPEVSNFGQQNVARIIDLAPYPPSRSFFFSVDVGF